jgi:hypothetical protein
MIRLQSIFFHLAGTAKNVAHVASRHPRLQVLRKEMVNELMIASKDDDDDDDDNAGALAFVGLDHVRYYLWLR